MYINIFRNLLELQTNTIGDHLEVDTIEHKKIKVVNVIISKNKNYEHKILNA